MNRRNPTTAILLCSLLLVGGSTFRPALAGDGSGTSNPALLRGTFAGGYPEPCSNPAGCLRKQQRAAPVASPVSRQIQPRQIQQRQNQPSSQVPPLPLPEPVPLPAAVPSSAPVALRPAREAVSPGNCQVLRAANIYSAECVGATASQEERLLQTAPLRAPQRAGAAPSNTATPLPPLKRQSISNISALTPIDLEMPQAHAPAAPTNAVSPLVTGSIPQYTPDAAASAPAVRQQAPRRISYGYPPASDAPNVNWSLTLRGAYVEDAEGGHYEAGLVPDVSIKMPTGRGELTLNGSSDLTKELDGQFRVNSGKVSLQATHALDAQTDLSGALRLGLSQDRPTIASDGSGVVQPPQYITGSAEGEVKRRFGRFGLGLSASALREVVGKTVAADGTETDNTYRNRTGYGFGARLEYELTPILSVFEQLRADRENFDAPSASLGAISDNWTYSARTGVAAKWQAGLSGEASVGYAFRNFDDSRLQDQDSLVYGATVTYSPSGRLTLAAEFNSDISDTGDVTGATARFGNDLTLRVNYLLSEWLQARATASRNWASYAGSPTTENGYSYGLGADWYVNSHLALSADYSTGESRSSTGTTERTQRIMAGVTVSN